MCSPIKVKYLKKWKAPLVIHSAVKTANIVKIAKMKSKWKTVFIKNEHDMANKNVVKV